MSYNKRSPGNYAESGRFRLPGVHRACLMWELGLNRHQFCHEIAFRPQRQPLSRRKSAIRAIHGAIARRHGIVVSVGKRIGARSLPLEGGYCRAPSRTPIRRKCPRVLRCSSRSMGHPGAVLLPCDVTVPPSLRSTPRLLNPANSAAELDCTKPSATNIGCPAGTCSGSEGSRNGPGLPGGFGRSRGRIGAIPSSSNPANRHAD